MIYFGRKNNEKSKYSIRENSFTKEKERRWKSKLIGLFLKKNESKQIKGITINS